jgi:hypothetical protein
MAPVAPPSANGTPFVSGTAAGHNGPPPLEELEELDELLAALDELEELAALDELEELAALDELEELAALEELEELEELAELETFVELAEAEEAAAVLALDALDALDPPAPAAELNTGPLVLVASATELVAVALPPKPEPSVRPPVANGQAVTRAERSRSGASEPTRMLQVSPEASEVAMVFGSFDRSISCTGAASRWSSAKASSRRARASPRRARSSRPRRRRSSNRDDVVARLEQRTRHADAQSRSLDQGDEHRHRRGARKER